MEFINIILTKFKGTTMLSMFKAIIAVLSAMFGVRSSKGFEEDKKISIYQIVFAGFLMTGLFLGSLVLIIKFIVLR